MRTDHLILQRHSPDIHPKRGIRRSCSENGAGGNPEASGTEATARENFKPTGYKSDGKGREVSIGIKALNAEKTHTFSQEIRHFNR